jgi:bacillaene synthase trans-acting acyltransferase/trans-AT polyketide synthase/acyltransferase/oxidoreductase domain-containing protein
MIARDRIAIFRSHMPRTIMMFCGQGAQYYQMGRELHQCDAGFRRAMARCDAITGDLNGQPVSTTIYSRPLGESDGFDDLADSNPALLAIGYALAISLLERGVQPDRLLGYSLGETIAAAVAGVLSLEDGFRLVSAQARLYAEHVPPGTLIAVLSEAAEVAAVPGIATRCEIAARNAPRHCVLSIRANDVPAIVAALDRAGLTWARLPIRFPFHSAAIDPVAAPMRDLFACFTFAPPHWPIISAATGTVVARLGGAHLWQAMRAPCRFQETLATLAQEGEWRLVEAGPSGTLTAFTRLCAIPGVRAFSAIDQFGQNIRTMNQIMVEAA